MSNPFKIQYKNFLLDDINEPLPIQIQEPIHADRVVRFVASDESVDYDSEVIKQDGWDFSRWIQNPICQAVHDLSAWPLGKGVAIGVVDKRLLIDIEFDPPEVDERADLVFRKIKHGTIKAGSVGFIPMAWKSKGDHGADELFKMHEGARRIFTRQKLLEWTICPLGANPNALVVARAKSFDAVPFEPHGLASDVAAKVEEKLNRIIKILK